MHVPMVSARKLRRLWAPVISYVCCQALVVGDGIVAVVVHVSVCVRSLCGVSKYVCVVNFMFIYLRTVDSLLLILRSLCENSWPSK